MTKLIPDVRLSRAKIAQHDEFMRDTLENAQACAGIEQYLPAQLAAFRTAVEAEHAMVSRPLRWELTPEITEADQRLDKALSALRSLMKAAVENPDAQAAEAAKVVLRMSEIDKISGQEQMDEESGKISAMLTTLLGEYREQTTQAGLMAYVVQLKERNERLCQLLQERDTQQGVAGPRDTAALRQATDERYRTLILDVNSVAECIALGIVSVSGGSAQGGTAANPFADFIDYQTGHIDRFHREVLHTSSNNTGTVEGSGGAEGSEEEGGEGGSETTAPTSYTLTFEHNGETVSTQQLEAGATITPPAAPSGYHWKDVPATMPAQNLTITTEEDEDENTGFQPPVFG